MCGVAKNKNSQNILEEQDGGTRLLDSKTCYKAMVIKRVWYRYRNRQIDQWDRREARSRFMHI